MSSTTTTSTDLGSIISAAFAGGYVAHPAATTYTVTQPIVIHVDSTMQGPVGIDLGGATIISQITTGAPVIEIDVGPGVDFRYLTLSNFTIQGNGSEGDGIKLVADGNDRWLYNFNVSNVTVNHVGGYGLEMQGSIFEGLISNSSMTNDGLGGANFGHSTNGGVASALRWIGGSLQNNGGAGITLSDGARDMTVDGVSFSGNHGPGISAMNGITSVTDSTFTDNQGAGIQYQLYGNFNHDTFSTSGSQTVGISGYMAGNTTLIGNTSTYTGSGADPTHLANLQGNGGLFATGDTGSLVTGSGVNVSGLHGGDLASVTVSTQGLASPTLSSVTTATTAHVADSNGTGSLETALKAALAGGTTHLTNSTYTVSAPIVINITGNPTGPIDIDLGGAKIVSQIANGGPVIEIEVGAGVNISSLKLSNFAIAGNGAEGDGIKIVADGTDRSIGSLSINNVEIEHTGGVGLDVLGHVSTGVVTDSWMNGNALGGARFANSAGGGVASGLQWVGGGFRHNGGAGLILDNGTHDMSVTGAYFVENNGPGIAATSGITSVLGSGFENNQVAGAVVNGTSSFTDDSFSTYGPQIAGVSGSANGGEIDLTGIGVEYYGTGSNPTVLANIQGTGTLAIAGGGHVIAGPAVAVTGGNPTFTTPSTSTTTASVPVVSSPVPVAPTPVPPAPVASAPVVTSRLASDTGSSATDGVTSAAGLTGTADANATVHFTVDGTAIAATATANASGSWSFTPTGLSDGVHTVVASETGTGGTGTATTAFTLQTHAPVPVFTSGAIANGQVTLTGSTGEAGDQVSIYDGTSWMGMATTGADGKFSYTGSASNAVHSYGANATSLAGIEGHGTTPLVVSPTAPATTSPVPPAPVPPAPVPPAPVASAPVVTSRLASDTGSSATDGVTSNAALTGTADANATIHFTVDGTAIAATATANASGSWSFTPTGLSDGVHTVVASETGTGGTGTASTAFTLQTQAATPVITAGSITNGMATLTGTVGTQAGDTISVYDGSSWQGFAVSDSTGHWTFTTAAAANVVHSYGVNATDLTGHESHGASSFLLGGTQAPTAPAPATMPVVTEKLAVDNLASTTDGITSNAGITGIADANATVHFTIDGAAVSATATADANGAWSFTPTGLGDGVHSVIASETNASGATGAAALSFTLDTHAPLPTFLGAVASGGQVTLTGTTGEAGDQVSIYDGNSWMGMATTGTDGTWSFTAGAAASSVHSYGANATNPAGNEGHGLGKLVLGSSTADTLVGTGGNDVLMGNGGNDRVTGGAGADKLTGGSGNATFAYNATTDSNFAAADVITDFRHGADKIDFTNISGLTAANGVPQFQGNISGSGALTLNANSVAFMEVGGNTQVLVNTSGAAETVTAADTHAADMKIVLVGVNLGLTASDFHHA